MPFRLGNINQSAYRFREREDSSAEMISHAAAPREAFFLTVDPHLEDTFIEM